LVAGKKHEIILFSTGCSDSRGDPDSRDQPKAGAFPLPFFRRWIINSYNLKSVRQSRDRLICIDQKNFLKTAHAANQLQSMPRERLPPERREQFILSSKPPRKPRRHKYRKTAHIVL
jgi:hypothetical protein